MPNFGQKKNKRLNGTTIFPIKGAQKWLIEITRLSRKTRILIFKVLATEILAESVLTVSFEISEFQKRQICNKERTFSYFRSLEIPIFENKIRNCSYEKLFSCITAELQTFIKKDQLKFSNKMCLNIEISLY